MVGQREVEDDETGEWKLSVGWVQTLSDCPRQRDGARSQELMLWDHPLIKKRRRSYLIVRRRKEKRKKKSHLLTEGDAHLP